MTGVLIFSANQWTGSYMIGTSVLKELRLLFQLQISNSVALLLRGGNILDLVSNGSVISISLNDVKLERDIFLTG